MDSLTSTLSKIHLFKIFSINQRFVCFPRSIWPRCSKPYTRFPEHSYSIQTSRCIYISFLCSNHPIPI